MKTTLLMAAAFAVLGSSASLHGQTLSPAGQSADSSARASQTSRTPPRLPPAGIAIPDADREALATAVAELKREIDALTVSLKAKPEAVFLPDVEIFHKAVDWPLCYNEFYNVKEVATAKKLLAMGKERAASLAKDEHPWTTQTGLVVRGYRSKIDGSVQPYGLVVPASWKPENKLPRKALVWLLGRGNNRTELAFLNERLGKPPEIGCPDGFTLIPYGRFCNATKFAGERDVFEAMEQMNAQYPIDERRTAVAGFSMGGASAWHLGTHYAGMWCAVSPGAGFAETREYAKVFAPGKTPPPAWEQTLWRWYDATEYGANLSNVPTLAYSGELDKQIQSAEIMKRFAEKEGVKIEHFVGPKTEHKYEPETRKALQARLNEIWENGNDAFPKQVRLVTYSMIYPTQEWVTVRQMEKHWERAEITANFAKDGSLSVQTKNIRAFSLALPEDGSGTTRTRPASIVVDGKTLTGPTKYNGWVQSFRKDEDGWKIQTADQPSPLRKQRGICGPIDHAFMSNFVHVRPTGAPMNEKVARWAQSELDHAQKYWRQIFRGEAPVKDDATITDSDIANSNLVLWGDPASNAVLKRIATKLPCEWTKEKLVFAGKNYDASKTAPVLIFPNPLNPKKYIVINSGVTFRESAMGTNSQQTPKLPDWAIVDLDMPPGPDWPGNVLEAGFFDDDWKVRSGASQ